jgi:hypothetical protein
MRMQREPRNRRADNLGMMMGFQQMDQNDLGLISGLQQMMAESMMAPEKLRGQQLSNELATEAVSAAPRLTEGKLEAMKLGGISDLAGGYNISPDVIQQMLMSQGLYAPDPEAELRKKAAQYGMTVEQLKQRIAQLNPIQK